MQFTDSARTPFRVPDRKANSDLYNRRDERQLANSGCDLFMRDDEGAATKEIDQHATSRIFRYLLAVLEAALRRVEELRRKPAKACIISSCNPSTT